MRLRFSLRELETFVAIADWLEDFETNFVEYPADPTNTTTDPTNSTDPTDDPVIPGYNLGPLVGMTAITAITVLLVIGKRRED